jgi:RNA polymerase sigma-70 factor (ECF subfamily)
LLGHRRDQADDAVQDAWIRATERLTSFRGEAAFRTWLSAYVVNCCRERLRADPRRYEDIPHDEGLFDSKIELTLDVDRALSRLAPGYRAVFVLHDIEGRTHDEIAALLEIEPGTSKSQLSRARGLLRKFLETRVTP